jgi:Hemerythrin HHE cation binding domain
VLHHHHVAEDEGLWPLLRARVSAAGDPAGLATLDAMAAEHGQIDPVLEAVRDGFAGMVARSTDAGRAALTDRLRDATAMLDHHLGHEERDAMALLHRHLTPADWQRVKGSTSGPRTAPGIFCSCCRGRWGACPPRPGAARWPPAVPERPFSGDSPPPASISGRRAAFGVIPSAILELWLARNRMERT